MNHTIISKNDQTHFVDEVGLAGLVPVELAEELIVEELLVELEL